MRTNSIVYRQIWENHYNQKIPPGMHIHHKDGNHNNNDIINLLLVTAEEHYNIHLAQGDYFECYLLAKQHLNKSKEEMSDLRRLSALKQLSEGTHPFQSEDLRKQNSLKQKEKWKNTAHPFQQKDNIEKLSTKRHEMLSNNTHTFTDPIAQKKRKASVKRLADNNQLYFQTHKELLASQNRDRQLNRAAKGELNLQSLEHRQKVSANMKALVAKQLADGTHHSQITVTCPHCGKIGKGKAVMMRHHFDRCKQISSTLEIR
jgi:hypothetical protein